MDRTASVKKAELPPGRRVLAISDIHGNLTFLKALLTAAGYTHEDILVLVGDLVEKGPASLAVLRYVMELSQTHTVYALRGNCDNLVTELLRKEWEPAPQFFHHYLATWKEHSLLVQLGQAAGFPLQTPEDLPELRRRVRARLAPEYEFLTQMPDILITPDYLFVHGGVPREDHLEDLAAHRCLKNDNFLPQGYAFRRWCVVGHWPVTLYDPQIPSAAPLLEHDRHIASIDGGCVLKADGQLNALVLPAAPAGPFSWYSYDGLPAARALDAQAESADSVNIRWGRSQVELLEEGPLLSRCRHLETGRELDILTEYLYTKEDLLFCEDSTDYRPPVEPGDALSIVRRLPDRALVKRNGVTGWYFGRLGEDVPPKTFFCEKSPGISA